jgi:hypothetical protein
MYRFIYLLFIVLFFTSCTSSKVNTLNNYIDFSKGEKIYTSDRCTSNSYIYNISSKEYGKIFKEEVSLSSDCVWNGFQRSFFDNLFKEKTHIKTMVALERVDFDSYEFSTYLINDKYILNLIYEYSPFKDTFIVDYKGLLFTKMIKRFNHHYKNLYLDKPRFSSNYKSSLVRENFIRNYYQKDIDYE